MLLAGKVAVVTGAAAGIGRATAILFAAHGARVFCIDEAPTGDVIAAIRDAGGDAAGCAADVGDEAAVVAAAAACERSYGRVDVLFNNAGRTIKQRFEDTSAATWDEMIATNLTGTFLCSKHFLRLMKGGGSGSIIHHASVDAFLGNPGIAAYSAAKGGLLPLTHVMAHDLGRYGIRVNCISSGGILSAMTAANRTETRVAVTPLQRMGTPDEVAKVALFLASDLSSYVDGANIVVDGGRTTITQGTYHG